MPRKKPPLRNSRRSITFSDLLTALTWATQSLASPNGCRIPSTTIKSTYNQNRWAGRIACGTCFCIHGACVMLASSPSQRRRICTLVREEGNLNYVMEPLLNFAPSDYRRVPNSAYVCALMRCGTARPSDFFALFEATDDHSIYKIFATASARPGEGFLPDTPLIDYVGWTPERFAEAMKEPAA